MTIDFSDSVTVTSTLKGENNTYSYSDLIRAAGKDRGSLDQISGSAFTILRAAITATATTPVTPSSSASMSSATTDVVVTQPQEAGAIKKMEQAGVDAGFLQHQLQRLLLTDGVTLKQLRDLGFTNHFGDDEISDATLALLFQERITALRTGAYAPQGGVAAESKPVDGKSDSAQLIEAPRNNPLNEFVIIQINYANQYAKFKKAGYSDGQLRSEFGLTVDEVNAAYWRDKRIKAGHIIVFCAMIGQGLFGMLLFDDKWFQEWGTSWYALTARVVLDALLFFFSAYGKYSLIIDTGVQAYADPKGVFKRVIDHKFYIPFTKISIPYLHILFALWGMFTASLTFSGLTRLGFHNPTEGAWDIGKLFLDLGGVGFTRFMAESSKVDAFEWSTKGVPLLQWMGIACSFSANLLSAPNLWFLAIFVGLPFLKNNLICKRSRGYDISFDGQNMLPQSVGTATRLAAIGAAASIILNFFGWLSFLKLGPDMVTANGAFIGWDTSDLNPGNYFGVFSYAFLNWMSVGVVPILYMQLAGFAQRRETAQRMLKPIEWGRVAFAIMGGVFCSAPVAFQSVLAKLSAFATSCSVHSSFMMEVGSMYKLAPMWKNTFCGCTRQRSLWRMPGEADPNLSSAPARLGRRCC